MPIKNRLVSTIITTKNEERNIDRLLKSIKSQSYKNIEIIVVDNYSSDKTVDIAKKFKSRLFKFGPERSAQRNYGAKKAKGEFLLFLDADMKLSTKVIEECLNVFKNTSSQKSQKIGGVIIPEKSIAHNFWGRVKAFERSFYNEAGDSTTDAARFFPKKVFRKAGGYDQTITGPEDWDLPETIQKMGFRFARISTKIYHYENISSLLDLGRKKFYYGLRSHRYLAKQGIFIISPKTVYFLRPVFLKSWKKLFNQAPLVLGLFIMLLVENLCGGFGFLIGKLKNE